jgi:tetratricopeptide (TPR) repeat protein
MVTGENKMKNRRKAISPQLSEEIEERLRPAHFLGYDRDHLGIALLEREMFELAVSQFRHAVYLNPYEADFKQHLAWGLFKLGKNREALKIIKAALLQKPDDQGSQTVMKKILETEHTPLQ